MRLRILHLTSDTCYGGVQEAVLALCRHVEAEHYVLRVHAGPLEAQFSQYATVIQHGWPAFEGVLPDALRIVKPDIIHAHNPGGTFPEFMKIAVESQVPVVENIHCWNVALEQEERWCAARIVACEALYGLQRTKDRLHIIPYSCEVDEVDTARARRDHYRKTLGISDRIVIGRLGNITPWKRPLDFIRSIAPIAHRASDAVAFILAGSAHENPGLIAKCIQEVNTTANGHKINIVSPVNDKFGLLSAFDIFLYPTTRESYCISIVEAMSCSLPIVSYRDTALPEVVGKGGILVKVGDIEGLVEAVIALIDSPAARREMGDMAANIIRTRNAPDVVARRYVAVYNEVLSTS